MKYKNIYKKSILVLIGDNLVSIPSGAEFESSLLLRNNFLEEILEKEKEVKNANKTISKKLR